MEANWSSRTEFVQNYFVVLSVDAIAGIVQARVISSNFPNLPSLTYTKSDNHFL